MKNYKYLTYITVYYVTILLISNIVSTKLTQIGFSEWKLTFDAGTFLFPLSYILWDILTEVYGYKQTKKIIWMWFVSMLFASLVIKWVEYLPSAIDWPFQKDYSNILWATYRIMWASLIAYLVGEFVNSYILAKVKIWMKGKLLFVRTISSTLLAQVFDTMIFVLIAFYGIYPNDVIIIIIISNYIFKVGVEVLFTPITYAIVGFLKKKDNEDYYDINTDFNPLKID